MKSLIQRIRTRLKGITAKQYLKYGLGSLAVAGVVGVAFASSTPVSIKDVHDSLDNGLSQVARIIMDVALLAGVGFTLTAIFKLWQHKNNPTQVPMSQGLTMLGIGAALLILPTIVTLAPQFFFKDAATAKEQMAQIGGSQIIDVIGGTKG